MSYPNAAKGVKNIFASEIIKLIGLILTIAGAFVAMVSFTAAAKNLSDSGDDTATATLALIGIGGAVLLLAGSALELVGAIVNIVGVAKASRDESTFKMSILFIIMSVATAVGAVLLVNVNAAVASFLNSATGLFGLFAYVMIVGGIIRLADRLNRSDISAIGNTIFKLLIAVQLLGLIANIVASILTAMGLDWNPVFIIALVTIAKILEMIQAFMYLSFLGKANKMLAKQ